MDYKIFVISVYFREETSSDSFSIKLSTDIVPKSSPLRVRIAISPASISLSPTTNKYGTRFKVF